MKRPYLLTVFIIAVFSVVCFSLNADNQKLIKTKHAAVVTNQVLVDQVKTLITTKHKLTRKNSKLFAKSKERIIENLSLYARNQALNKQLESKNQFENCFNATCRVKAKDDRGTGCSFLETKDSFFVVTNAHVVGNYKTIFCEFWRNGHLLKPFKGKIISKDKGRDVAIVAINKSDLPRDFVIATVPLAPLNYKLKKGQTIASVGCVQANWPSLFKGHFIKYNKNDITFLPKPEGGRSGSAIFDAKGKMIVGLLWGVSDTGHAKSLKTIYDVIIKTKKKLLYFTSSSCLACKKQAPIIDRLIKEGYNFEIINNNPEIKSLPTIVIGDQKVEGFRSYKDLKKLLDS